MSAPLEQLLDACRDYLGWKHGDLVGGGIRAERQMATSLKPAEAELAALRAVASAAREYIDSTAREGLAKGNALRTALAALGAKA